MTKGEEVITKTYKGDTTTHIRFDVPATSVLYPAHLSSFMAFNRLRYAFNKVGATEVWDIFRIFDKFDEN